MTRKLTVIVALMLLSATGLFAQGIAGVYQVELEGYNGETISKGTSFSVRAQYGQNTYIMTSFHVLNARLLEAERIKFKTLDGGTEYLKIAAYDELNDILLLSGGATRDLPLSLSDDCSKSLSVVGYHNDKMLVMSANGVSGTSVRGVNKLSVYLTKGFSGAPVLNNEALICGMVVLSSEMNANSVIVSSELLSDLIKKYEAGEKRTYTVKEIRQQLGVEKIVNTQEELDRLTSDSTVSGQKIISISPINEQTKFIIKNAENFIVEGENISKLVIHQSRNIMVRGINVERLTVNESESVTVTSCVFDKGDKALFLKDSRNLVVNRNLFRNMNTGVVLMSAAIDEANIAQDNSFSSVGIKVSKITAQN